MFSQVIHAFQGGGVFMYLILAFFVVTIGFIAERAYALYFKIKPSSEELITKVRAAIAQGRLQDAKDAALQSPNLTISKIILRGLEVRAMGLSDEELRARMDEILAENLSQIDRRTGFLAMFGNVATLAGLLGTISGMIKSFAAVASANPAERAALLSVGISEAMNCTAFGLFVAIPALSFYAILQNKTDKITTQLTESTSKIFHDLLFRVEAMAEGKISKTYQQERTLNH